MTDADLRAAALADRLTGVRMPLTPCLDRLHEALVPDAAARPVVAAIQALPACGLSWRAYAHLLDALVSHLLDASDAVGKTRCAYEAHGLLDAAHEAEHLAEWFAEQADAEDGGAADEARARYYAGRRA